MTLAVTGHRPNRINGQEKGIKMWLNREIELYKPDTCISGMAQGVDQMFAYSALAHHCDLWCAMPYHREKNPMPVNYLLSLARIITYTCRKYQPDCYTLRDKYMVDHCDVLLVVWDGQEGGGTYYTMKYAESIHKPMEVLRIEPNLDNKENI